MSATKSGLPRLILVPDELWDEFEGTLRGCGIALINTDRDRSFRVVATDSLGETT